MKNYFSEINWTNTEVFFISPTYCVVPFHVGHLKYHSWFYFSIGKYVYQDLSIILQFRKKKRFKGKKKQQKNFAGSTELFLSQFYIRRLVKSSLYFTFQFHSIKKQKAYLINRQLLYFRIKKNMYGYSSIKQMKYNTIINMIFKFIFESKGL